MAVLIRANRPNRQSLYKQNLYPPPLKIVHVLPCFHAVIRVCLQRSIIYSQECVVTSLFTLKLDSANYFHCTTNYASTSKPCLMWLEFPCLQGGLNRDISG